MSEGCLILVIVSDKKTLILILGSYLLVKWSHGFILGTEVGWRP